MAPVDSANRHEDRTVLNSIPRYVGQAVCYALFVLVIGYFSTAPAYVHFPPDQALLKLSFSHAGAPLEPCHVRTAAELQALPPNMRLPTLCGRERSQVTVELALDGKPIYRAELPPRGLARDGASTVYRRFPVPAGTHHLRARLNDGARNPELSYVKEADVTVAPGQVFVVDFNARAGGFVFK
jgi:hypothetical protein